LVPVFLVPVFLVPVFLVPVFLVPVFLVPVLLVPVFLAEVLLAERFSAGEDLAVPWSCPPVAFFDLAVTDSGLGRFAAQRLMSAWTTAQR
jgi:hypothetical protein